MNTLAADEIAQRKALCQIIAAHVIDDAQHALEADIERMTAAMEIAQILTTTEAALHFPLAELAVKLGVDLADGAA